MGILSILNAENGGMTVLFSTGRFNTTLQLMVLKILKLPVPATGDGARDFCNIITSNNYAHLKPSLEFIIASNLFMY